MRKGFEQYYRPSKLDLSDLWQNCVFVFDTNVLLDLYRYTPETKDELFSVLEKLTDRIWIPHQVALEFHRNRLETVAAVFEPYRKVRSLLGGMREEILKGLSHLSSKHPFIKIDKVRARVADALMEIIKELDELAEQHPNQAKRADKDDIRERLTKLFDGKTGDPLDESRLQEIFKEGETRFAKKIPPGYMDEKSKERENKFGDLVVWKEILAFAAKNKKSIIFVTGDSKEDWWEMSGGMTTGPRPEIRHEFWKETGCSFYMYETSNFLKRVTETMGHEKPAKEAAVKEIQAVHQERTIDEEAFREAFEAHIAAERLARTWLSDEEAIRKALEAQRPPWQDFIDAVAAERRARTWLSDEEAVRKALEAQRPPWQDFIDAVASERRARTWLSDEEAVRKALEVQRAPWKGGVEAIKSGESASAEPATELPQKEQKPNNRMDRGAKAD